MEGPQVEKQGNIEKEDQQSATEVPQKDESTEAQVPLPTTLSDEAPGDDQQQEEKESEATAKDAEQETKDEPIDEPKKEKKKAKKEKDKAERKKSKKKKTKDKRRKGEIAMNDTVGTP